MLNDNEYQSEAARLMRGAIRKGTEPYFTHGNYKCYRVLFKSEGFPMFGAKEAYALLDIRCDSNGQTYASPLYVNDDLEELRGFANELHIMRHEAVYA